MPKFITNEAGIPLLTTNWLREDKEKAIAMIKRGKSNEFIHGYMGMPVSLIGYLRGQLEKHNPGLFDEDRSNAANRDEEPLPSDLLRRAKQFRKRNKRFLRALRNAGFYTQPRKHIRTRKQPVM